MPSIWTDGPGPFRVTGVQFSGSMPGGHGSASFDVPVANAYLAPHHTLTEGAWIVLYDDAHELYEGEIFSIKPSVDSSGQHKLSVTCGGLISVAGKRADVSATWVHRGSVDWIRLPGTPSSLGSVSFDNGVVDLRVSKGSAQNYNISPITNMVAAAFVVDSGLSDETISYVTLVCDWNVVTESAHIWEWDFCVASSLGTLNWGAPQETATNSTGAATTYSFAPAAGTKTLAVCLWCADLAHSVSADMYVTLTEVSVYAQGRTTKPRLDEAMVSLATRTGLATSSLSEPVGAMLDDLHVGNGLQKVSAAQALTTIAGLHAQPVEYAFWDNKQFVCRGLPGAPMNDAQVIVVGGGNPGLESWDVAEYDEDVPNYSCVLYGNKDDATLPEAWPRRMYRPTTPPDNADLRVEIVDYSSLILSDASAAAAGDSLTGTSGVASPTGTTIPDGAVFDAVPALAKLGKYPGNNADPTSAYRVAYDAAVSGTLSGFAYTASSGWAGTNSPADPTCLVGDGVNDYVDFGDLAVCDFGTSAFSLRAWLKLNALPSAGSTYWAASKRDVDRGWSLGVTSAGKLRGYVGGSGAVAPGPVVSATGTYSSATDGAYTVLTFTGNGSVVVTSADNTPVAATALVVGGGAAGGQANGGGGAAGGLYEDSVSLTGTMTVTVGSGGTTAHNNGGNSTFGARTAAGGGYGGYGTTVAATGASGGGGSSSSGYTAGGGSTGPGNVGGNGSANNGGGGGGGMGAAGQAGSTGYHGGNGGAGTTSAITGTSLYYAAGGGGAGYGGSGVPGSGGSSIGGAGGASGAAGDDATANRGSGGGGSGNGNNTAGKGSDGVVVVRFLSTPASANSRQQSGSTVMVTGRWYDCAMTYAGSGGDIALYVNGVAESLTAAGTVGAYDLSTAASVQLFKGPAATYLSAALSRVTAWPRVLTAEDLADDEAVGPTIYGRSMDKGTVVISGTVKNRQGTTVPAHHVRAGWWIQHLETVNSTPLYITGHSVDLAAKKNALTIGIDWMEKEIGVRQAELLAIPATVVPEPVQEEYVPAYTYEAPSYDPGSYADETPAAPPMTPPPPIGPAPVPEGPITLGEWNARGGNIPLEEWRRRMPEGYW